MALVLMLAVNAGPSWARGVRNVGHGATAVSPPQACLDAIAAAEITHGVPTGFLLAIARVESGRMEPRSGLVQPWPWTIDIGGRGAFYDNQTEAVDAVREKQAEGVASVDVGCMQVNLQQHPAAFASLDDAFNPVINARYAASFLVGLHQESGDWTIAAGLYHSRTEVLAGPYRVAVASRFAAAGGMPSPSALAAAAVPVRPIDVMATAWAATLTKTDATTRAFAVPQGFVVPQASVVQGDGPLRLWPKMPSDRGGVRLNLGRSRHDLRLSAR